MILLAFSQVRERFFDEPAASLTDCHSCEFGLGWSTWRLRSEVEKRSRRSNQDSLDRTVFLDAREPHVDAQAVQNRGVEVVDVCGVLDDVVTVDRKSTGSPFERRAIPWYLLGRKPADQSRLYRAWAAALLDQLAVITSKAGRFWFIVPRP